MAISIFDYTSYKDYLNESLDQLNETRSGQRSRLARALPCHSAYISQVLNGAANFSLEQAEKINVFLSHSDDESSYFLNLIQYERAGTESLRLFFKKQLTVIVERRLDLKTRLTFEKSLLPEMQSIYYSSWHYAAVHVLSSIPELNTREKLAHFLKLPATRIAHVLEFLCRTGLLKESRGHYAIGTAAIHLGKESPHIARHHANWRLRAVDAIENAPSTGLHYSSVATMSVNDSVKVRKIFVEAIEKVRKIIKASKDETGYCYNIDFFPL